MKTTTTLLDQMTTAPTVLAPACDHCTRVGEGKQSTCPFHFQPGAPARLSTAQLLVTLQQLGTALQNAGEAFSKMPNASPDMLPALLEQIVNFSASAGSKATRLLAANR